MSRKAGLAGFQDEVPALNEEELVTSHAWNVWDTGYSRHTGGETCQDYKAVFMLWDGQSWTTLY